MTESSLVTKIKKALKKQRPGRWIKIHGGPFQEAGISDIIGCYMGKFYALEVKLPGKEKNLTDLQEQFIEDIISAGGAGGMITSVEQALKIVKKTS
jgi:hypothetical protein